jgi:hypothetical protein
MSSTTGFIDVNAPVSDDVRRQIRTSDNNALIIRLHFTVHHLSRWLTPIHDASLLERARFRGEPTAKDLVIGMRQEEERTFPKMYLISTQLNADLDALPEWREDPDTVALDRDSSTIVLMAAFRRLRQSTCSLLRSLPDDAWDLRGRTSRGANPTVRELAEHLAVHDYALLHALDQTLDQTGARDDLAAIQKTHLDELMKLVPTSVRL